jgi:hypothetical protein
MSNEATADIDGCQEILQVERLYWQSPIECGKRARFTWKSRLRGKLRLCLRHARRVGLARCKELPRRTKCERR